MARSKAAGRDWLERVESSQWAADAGRRSLTGQSGNSSHEITLEKAAIRGPW